LERQVNRPVQPAAAGIRLDVDVQDFVPGVLDAVAAGKRRHEADPALARECARDIGEVDGKLCGAGAKAEPQGVEVQEFEVPPRVIAFPTAGGQGQSGEGQCAPGGVVVEAAGAGEQRGDGHRVLHIEERHLHA
jgi:hypothetical protein